MRYSAFIRQNYDILQEIIDNMRTGIWITDGEGKVLIVNNESVTVSYTHLDVYKRQRLRWPTKYWKESLLLMRIGSHLARPVCLQQQGTDWERTQRKKVLMHQTGLREIRLLKIRQARLLKEILTDTFWNRSRKSAIISWRWICLKKWQSREKLSLWKWYLRFRQ